MASTVPRPTIPQFYAKRSVLITGATGFVGKVPHRIGTACYEPALTWYLADALHGRFPLSTFRCTLQQSLLEQLLKTCPDVGNVYLIVRPKKGVPPQERVKEIVDCPVRLYVRALDALAGRTF